MKKYILLLLLLLITKMVAIADKFKGRICDINSVPIIGACVENVNLKYKTYTDIDGKFIIMTRPGNSIRFSCLGFHSELITYHKKQQIIILKDTDNFKKDSVKKVLVQLCNLVKQVYPGKTLYLVISRESMSMFNFDFDLNDFLYFEEIRKAIKSKDDN